MKALNLISLISTPFLAAMTVSAFAQQPPDVVASDASSNTAMGTNALLSLTSGTSNTAAGALALQSNTTGIGNSAFGGSALAANTTGVNNSACGLTALRDNTTGFLNTATGASALQSNVSGTANTSVGADSLFSNLGGNSNTAIGVSALYQATGANNFAAGYQAGFNLTTGSNNIDIGSPGVAGESNTIRIGTRGTQKVTVIAGVYGIPVSGSAVFVSPTGRLGVTVSSERYKTAITPIGADSEKLAKLRPVSFRLKTDPRGAVQYGLIAEEVAKIYPELVIRNEQGRIDGVRYDELAPMLLNEAQKERDKVAAQAEQLQDMQRQLSMMQETLAKLQAKDELVAQR